MSARYTERDAKIVAAVLQEGQTKTHAEIAKYLGVSRGIVSSVMFRHRNPELVHTSRPPRKIPYAGAAR